MSKQLEKSIDLELARIKAEKLSRGKWEPTKFKTICCETILFSSQPGEFVRCKCGKVGVDQTQHYMRVIGNIELLEEFSPGL